MRKPLLLQYDDYLCGTVPTHAAQVFSALLLRIMRCFIFENKRNRGMQSEQLQIEKESLRSARLSFFSAFFVCVWKHSAAKFTFVMGMPDSDMLFRGERYVKGIFLREKRSFFTRRC